MLGEGQGTTGTNNEPLRKRRRNAIYLQRGSHEEQQIRDIGARHLLTMISETLPEAVSLVENSVEESKSEAPPPPIEEPLSISSNSPLASVAEADEQKQDEVKEDEEKEEKV